MFRKTVFGVFAVAAAAAAVVAVRYVANKRKDAQEEGLDEGDEVRFIEINEEEEDERKQRMMLRICNRTKQMRMKMYWKFPAFIRIFPLHSLRRRCPAMRNSTQISRKTHLFQYCIHVSLMTCAVC